MQDCSRETGPRSGADDLPERAEWRLQISAFGDQIDDYHQVSWDILIQDLPGGVASIVEIPDGFRPQPLGDRRELITKIIEVAPTADFSDPAWGQLQTPDFVIEFNMGGSAITDSIMLHVRGGGPAAEFVSSLLHHLGRRAVDCSAGEFFDDAAAAGSFARWQTYRDKVIDP